MAKFVRFSGLSRTVGRVRWGGVGWGPGVHSDPPGIHLEPDTEHFWTMTPWGYFRRKCALQNLIGLVQVSAQSWPR